jgi:hypothetical protein
MSCLKASRFLRSCRFCSSFSCSLACFSSASSSLMYAWKTSRRVRRSRPYMQQQQHQQKTTEEEGRGENGKYSQAAITGFVCTTIWHKIGWENDRQSHEKLPASCEGFINTLSHWTCGGSISSRGCLHDCRILFLCTLRTTARWCALGLPPLPPLLDTAYCLSQCSHQPLK